MLHYANSSIRYLEHPRCCRTSKTRKEGGGGYPITPHEASSQPKHHFISNTLPRSLLSTLERTGGASKNNMNVPDVVRGDFVCQHVLFANVGEMKRHPRASVAELTSLLRPESAQKSTAPKDQVGHWYEAQLLHYGLPRSKEKNTAKMRLL